MKKSFYLLAAAAAFAACSENKGYVVTGTVEGAADGDTVYLAAVEGRQLVNVDSTTIQNGTFTFKGVQDTAVARYITYKAEGKEGLNINFFLENGKINVNVSEGANDSATGTLNNDAYQEIRVQLNEINGKMREIYESMSDTTLTDEQREAKGEEMNELQEKQMAAVKNGIAKNITNLAGITLLKQNYYYLSVEELDPLMPQIPAAFDNDERIIRIKENVEKMKATAAGQKFTDFEMQTPEGETVKLSDYVGKGKVVLVDFWASWCGPCRRETAVIKDLLKEYGPKGLDVVGVAVWDEPDNTRKAIEELALPWPQILNAQSVPTELYGIAGIPTIIIIDPDGKIVSRDKQDEELRADVAACFPAE